ncbi:energy transducer TonB [Flavobacterium sp. HSC-61S13]|uniref:energy transducer TonB n=1 Tax=Flavobacterium sp. HSC-61S13 TaxID=2910963 RepID=UPI00209C83B1|nr:energy transducer TonB [Flavobacterium sp. HSC-61S13]MCP1996942.1 protein TonB [Flavobacterium sp. HSC-61S13]
MSKLNIFRKEWLDIVFENRNKKYGAYALRSENPKTTTVALFMGFALFGLAISSPLIIRGLEGRLGDNRIVPMERDIPVVWDAKPITIPVKEIPEPEPIKDESQAKPIKEAPASAVDMKRHVAYKVTDDPTKITEEPTKASDLVNADPGSVARVGVDGGAINTGGSTGEGKGNDGAIGGITEGSSGNEVFDFVQVKAAPVGGFEVFNKMFISRFRSPEVGNDIKKIQVIVKFIVEKDGSLSDISILRDPGYGAGKEALRVLQNMPKWKPAIQNNRQVRSQFTLPITIQVQ